MQHDNIIFYHVQEVTTINDVAKSVWNIYVDVENRKVDHQNFVVELQGIISKQPISILIELKTNISYVSPQIVEACAL
jgi:hypothetical protein